MLWSSSFFLSIPGYGIFVSLFRLLLLWTNSVYTEFFHEKFNCPFTLLGVKRIFWLTLFAFVLPTLMIWNHIGFYLDNVLFPRWKETIVKTPLFLIGNARSGTTWLHRVITESDPKTFTTLKTWEILFAVSITWRVLFHLLYHLDRWFCFGLWYRLLCTVEHLVVGNIAIHPIGLEKVEEDEWLMMHIGLAQLLMFFFPSSSSMVNPLILFDYHSDMLQAIRESATADLLSSSTTIDGMNGARSRSNSLVGGNMSGGTSGTGNSGTTHITSSSATSSASTSSSSIATTSESSARHHSLLQTFFFISQQERGKGNMLSLAHRFGIFTYYKECVQRHLYFHAFVKPTLTSTMTLAPITSLPSRVLKKLPFASYLFPTTSSATEGGMFSRTFSGSSKMSSTTSSSSATGLMPSLVFVSKNPAFTLRIPTIYATFPDAKIVCLLRDPMQSVPSMVSYISHVWHVFNNPKERYPNAEELLGFCEAHYLFPLLHLHISVKPTCQWSFLSYHHARDNLKYHVLSMLSRLFDSQQFHRITNETMSIALTKEQMNTSKSLSVCCLSYHGCTNALSLPLSHSL